MADRVLEQDKVTFRQASIAPADWFSMVAFLLALYGVQVGGLCHPGRCASFIGHFGYGLPNACVWPGV